MTKLIQAVSSSISTISNFFETLFGGIMSIIQFLGDGIDFIIYSVKTIFSLFTSLF